MPAKRILPIMLSLSKKKKRKKKESPFAMIRDSIQ